tara:strand:- start:143 stop:589 length:447 start_codon:yes stop_codon:yes gene_type:complete
MDKKEIQDMLVKHEGLVLQVYKDSLGYDTIGVGRCLDKNGISEDEAMYLLNNDIDKVLEGLDKHLQGWRAFPKRARMVAIDMSFQMGLQGFLGFRKTIALMKLGMWLEASEEIINSKYYTQTPSRCLYNSRQLSLCQNGQQNIGRSSE